MGDIAAVAGRSWAVVRVAALEDLAAIAHIEATAPGIAVEPEAAGSHSAAVEVSALEVAVIAVESCMVVEGLENW